MDIIETNNLTKKFNGITAVNNLNLKVRDGETLGLLGPNGAGKTTLLLMLATLRNPTSGTAKVNGFDIIREQHNVRKSIGMVFQDPSSDDILTGRENLILHGLLYGIPKDQRDKKIDEVLDLVNLSARQSEIVKNYSGGMRRRLEIARGLMHKPKILFLDEPTLGLDPQSRESIWRHIEKLKKENKMTIIITTHYMEEADRLCDRVAIIDAGKIVALDTPENLKKVLKGDIISLKLSKPNLSTIKKMRFVKKIEKTADGVRLTVEDAHKNLQAVLKAIGKVEFVEVREPTLNDVFLHFTGKTINEEAEGGFFERWARVQARGKQ